jgi:hypothetical protein
MTPAQVVRYNWYWTKITFNDAPYFLTWCRYSFFLILYPLGVAVRALGEKGGLVGWRDDWAANTPP